MKKKFAIEVDCANCARKMEEAANKIEGVTATVSFMQQKLIVEAPDDRFEELMDQVVKVCGKIEPDCVIRR